MKTDYLLYKLFQACPDLPFKLADWPVPVASAYTLRAEEVKETRFQLDGVRVPTADNPTLPVVFLGRIEQRPPGTDPATGARLSRTADVADSIAGSFL